jgi:hypothetical protein
VPAPVAATCEPVGVYHVEIRQFPHNVCRFNLTERELQPIAVPWAREEWVELGERKWNVNQATLTIIEGPQLSLPQLAMGRGWRNAQRQGQVVTDRVLETLKQAPGTAPQTPAASATAASATARAGERGPANPSAERAAGDLDLLGDSLGLEILAALDQGPVTLARVWRLAGARLRDRPSSEALALGERAIRSLLERGLVVLQALPVGTPVEEGTEPALEDVAQEQLEPALRAIEGWAGGAQSALLGIRRA